MFGFIIIGLELALMIIGIIACYKICKVCDIYIKEHTK